MTTAKKMPQPSAETQIEALRIAKANQKEGQSKEQTKLIAQGIQKGIEQYKKQQKAKAREHNKLKKKNARQKQQLVTPTEESTSSTIVYRQHWLPWTILVLSWLGFAGYLLGFIQR